MKVNNSSKLVMHIVESAGGVERYLYFLLSNMVDNKEYKHIIICSDKLNIQLFSGLADVVVIDSFIHPISFSADFKAVRTIRKIIKQYKPDIVYCHSSKAGAIGRIANFGMKNRLVYNAHGWAFNIRGIKKIKTLFYTFVERVLSPFADVIVCISEFEKQSAINHHICNSSKLKVIQNGIDFGDITLDNIKTRYDLNIPEDAFVVGTVGRLTKQKAPEIFVKAAYIIKKYIPNAFFLMVGDDISDGVYRLEIKKLISECGLDDCFRITGWVDKPLDYVAVFDVATLFSRWEGFGLVLPEYMYMGKPIVATKVDAISEVVGDAGLLIDVDDYHAAADSIICLYKDSVLYSKLRNNGKNRLSLFDIRRTAEEHIQLFNNLLITSVDC